jgi:hypothetical protein
MTKLYILQDDGFYAFDENLVSDCCEASTYLNCDRCSKCFEICNKINIDE